MSQKFPLLWVGFIVCLLSSVCNAQNNCGCQYTISPSLANGITLAPWRTGAYYFNPKPGDTICLSGNYPDLRIDGISGTIDSPIVFKNTCTGIATFNSTNSNAPFQLTNVQYVKISGFGNSSVNYGISFDCSGSAGISIFGTKVRNIEIEGIEVKRSGFAGIMIKQDPTCDPKTWRDSMTMYDIDLHHNYIHHVDGEGFYIGNSFWHTGMVRTCGTDTITVYPHRILGLKIHDNIVKNTGWDGIQYGCSPNARVFNNVIENTGLKKVSQQTNGVQIGCGSGGYFYNNIIRNPGSTALAIIGFSDTTRIYNNLIVNAFEGIFADTRDSIKIPKIELQIYNNTIINASDNGMKIYDGGYQYKNASNQWVFFPKAYQPRVKNNVIIGPYFDFKLLLRDPSVSIDSSNNYKLRTPFASPTMSYFISEKLNLFADTLNYALKNGSYLIDKGTNTVSNVVLNDMLGVPRPQGVFYDLGAYEYENTPPIQALTAKRSPVPTQFKIYPSVVSDILSIDLPSIETDAELAIFDITGKMQIKQRIFKDDNLKNINIPVSNLPQGYYLCAFINDKNISSLKFIKQ